MEINSRFLLPVLLKAKGGIKLGGRAIVRRRCELYFISKYQVKITSFCTRINFSVNSYSVF